MKRLVDGRAPGSRRRRRRAAGRRTCGSRTCGACRRPRRRGRRETRRVGEQPVAGSAAGRCPARPCARPKAITAVRMVWTSRSVRCQSIATRRRPKASRSSPSVTRLSGFCACSCAMRSTPVSRRPGSGEPPRRGEVGHRLAHAPAEQLNGERRSSDRCRPARRSSQRLDPVGSQPQAEVQASVLRMEALDRRVEFASRSAALQTTSASTKCGWSQKQRPTMSVRLPMPSGSGW